MVNWNPPEIIPKEFQNDAECVYRALECYEYQLKALSKDPRVHPERRDVYTSRLKNVQKLIRKYKYEAIH